MFYKVKRVFRNIIRWFPIIKEDEDYDFDFIYKVLDFKLKKTYDFLTSKDAWGIHHSNHLKKLKICVILSDRILKHEYLERALIPHNRVHGTDTCDLKDPNNVMWVDENLIVRWNPNKHDSFSKACKRSEYTESQDYEMLHDIMKKYSRSWWD